MTYYEIDQARMNKKSAMGMGKPAHDRAIEHFERLVEQKVLVPVTIDYEAAEIAYSNCETSKGVVDAALGGNE